MTPCIVHKTRRSSTRVKRRIEKAIEDEMETKEEKMRIEEGKILDKRRCG